MFRSYRDTQEKVDYLRRTGHHLPINISWMMLTLETVNRKAERYEEMLMKMADLIEREPADEASWEVMKMLILSVRDEARGRSGQFPQSDLDWQEVEKRRKNRYE